MVEFSTNAFHYTMFNVWLCDPQSQSQTMHQIEIHKQQQQQQQQSAAGLAYSTAVMSTQQMPRHRGCHMPVVSCSVSL